MLNFNVFIDRKNLNKKGEATIYIVTHVDYKTVKFSTEIKCAPNIWDNEKNRIKGKAQEVQDKNLLISDMLGFCNEIAVKYRLRNIPLTIDMLKNELKNPSRQIDFHAFLAEIIQERKNDMAYGTWKHHKSFAVKLKQFRLKLSFSEINEDFLDEFERWLRDKRKNQVNTINTSMRIFRAYMNIAVKKKVIDSTPFTGRKLKKKFTERTHLTKAELQKLIELYNKFILPETEQRVLRHYLFMCMTGVRISDFKALTKQNVSDRSLFLVPQKTKGIKSKVVRIPLNDIALMLINDENSQDDNLFKSISEQKMNVYIKVIAGQYGIKKEITNHTARHTFATLFLEAGGNIVALKDLLGHSKIEETMQYIHVTPKMLNDGMDAYIKSLL